MKTLREQGLNSGEDDEGEIIDVNNIQKALRSVGISMDDFFAGTEGLDSVIMRLAEKWDSLSFETQRFIATTAAGSRQQSRFIALLSDYDRTMELVSAANNSAGASQEQYAKTLDTIQTSLAKLKNAWDELIMGLTNNELLKGAVDALTGLLTVVNNLIEALSGGNGLAKSFITLAGAIGMIKGGRAVFGGTLSNGEGAPGLLGSVLNLKNNNALEKNGEKAGKAYGVTFSNSLKKYIADSGSKTFGSFLADNFSIKNSYGAFNSADINFFSGSNKLGDSFKKSLWEQIDASSLDEDLKFDLVKTVHTGTFDEIKAKFSEVGLAATVTGKQVKEAGLEFIQADQNAKNLGNALGTLGGVLLTLISAWEEANGGANGFTTVIKSVAIGLMAIPPILQIVGATATTTGITVSAAFWPLTIAVAALGAIVGGLIAMDKAAKANSYEGRMEAAAEATKHAQTAAEEAKQAYDNLLSAKSEYTELHNTLDGLTQGTLEWKQALIEANNQVLQLLQTYPELAQYMTRGENGELKISSEGFDVMLNKQLEQTENAQAMAAGSEALRSNIMGNADAAADYIIGLWEEFRQGSTEAASKISSILGRDSFGNINQYATSEGIDKNWLLEEYGNELADYAQVNGTLDISKGAMNLSYGLGIKASDAINADKEVGNDIINAFAENGIKGFDEAIERETAELLEAYTREDLQELYKAKTGSDPDEEWGNEYLAKMLATEGVMSDMAKDMNAFYDTFSKWGEEEQENFEKYYLDEGLLGSSDLENFFFEDGQIKFVPDDDGTYDSTKATIAGILGFSSEEFGFIAQSLGIEVEDLISTILLNVQTAKSKLDEAGAQLEVLGQKTTFKNYSADSQAILGNKLIGAEARTGMSENISSLINSVFLKTDLTKEQEESFISALDMIDWTSVESIQGLSEILEDMGLAAKIGEDNIEKFEKQLINFNNATRNINIESLEERITSALELREGIEEGQVTFTKDMRDAIVKALPDTQADFVRTGSDEFTYIGNQEQLLADINANVAKILGEVSGDANELVAQGKQVANMGNRTFSGDYETPTEKSQLDVIEDLLNGRAGVATGSKYGAEGYTPLGEEVVTDGYNISYSELLALAGNMGLTTELMNGWEVDWIISAISQKYNEVYGEGGATYVKNMGAVDYLTDDEIEQAAMSTMTGQEIIEGGYTEDNKIKALDAQITKVEGLDIALENMNEEFGKYSEILKKAAVIDGKKAANNLKNLTTTINDNSEALADANKGTDEYNEALSKITKAAKLVFGENIDTKFIEENKQDFIDWADGSEEALERIKEAIITNLIDSLEGSEAEITAKTDAIKNAILELDNLSFDIYGNADMSDIFNQLASVMGSAKEAAAVIESLGYTVTWQMVSDGELTTGPDGRIISFPTYETIVTRTTDNSAPSSGGGGGGGGSSDKKWENPYDHLYNLTEKINESLRERNRIESRYDLILRKSGTTAEKLFENTQAQINKLKEEKALREEMLAARQQEAKDFMAEESDMNKYGKIIEENGTFRIEIDWDLINSITDEEEGQKIEEYIGELEEIQSQIEDEIDALDEMEETLLDIYDMGKDDFYELEDKVIEALKNSYQAQIDTAQQISDSIYDSNSKVIDSMQTSLDKYRQERDNADTEEELQNKQRRLSYLQQDTSGANQLEILKLQEELREGQEDYTDTLIDQKISELQEQNDRAQEQRQQQIDIAQAQLERAIENGELWQEAYELINNGIDKVSGQIIDGSRLQELLRNEDTWQGMSYFGKIEWAETMENMVSAALLWLQQGRSIEGLMATGELKAGEKITFTDGNGKQVTGVLNSNGTVSANGLNYSGIHQNVDGSFITNDQGAKPVTQKPTQTAQESTQTISYPYGKASETSGIIEMGNNGQQVKAIQYALNQLGYGNEGTREVDGQFGGGTWNAVYNFQVGAGMANPDGMVGDKTRAQFKLRKYKTGGLADFTGPAWLDGTPSSPEIVLNQRDSQNFIQLRDILRDWMANGDRKSESSGDFYFDVDINVDKLDSDYGTAGVAEEVKRLVTEAAMYRNVNAINNKR